MSALAAPLVSQPAPGPLSPQAETSAVVVSDDDDQSEDGSDLESSAIVSTLKPADFLMAEQEPQVGLKKVPSFPSQNQVSGTVEVQLGLGSQPQYQSSGFVAIRSDSEPEYGSEFDSEGESQEDSLNDVPIQDLAHQNTLQSGFNTMAAAGMHEVSHGTHSRLADGRSQELEQQTEFEITHCQQAVTPAQNRFVRKRQADPNEESESLNKRIRTDSDTLQNEHAISQQQDISSCKRKSSIEGSLESPNKRIRTYNDHVNDSLENIMQSNRSSIPQQHLQASFAPKESDVLGLPRSISIEGLSSKHRLSQSWAQPPSRLESPPLGSSSPLFTPRTQSPQVAGTSQHPSQSQHQSRSPSVGFSGSSVNPRYVSPYATGSPFGRNLPGSRPQSPALSAPHPFSTSRTGSPQVSGPSSSGHHLSSSQPQPRPSTHTHAHGRTPRTPSPSVHALTGSVVTDFSTPRITTPPPPPPAQMPGFIQTKGRNPFRASYNLAEAEAAADVGSDGGDNGEKLYGRDEQAEQLWDMLTR